LTRFLVVKIGSMPKYLRMPFSTKPSRCVARLCRLLGLMGFIACAGVVSAAQPDYPGAIWRPAAAGHWYTTGNAHAFVVEHDMEGYYLSTISYFQQAGTQASIHYCVNSLHNGSDSQGHAENNPNDSPAGEITQMVEEQYWAWHVLCWNRYMFGTEHEGFVSNPAWYSDAMYQASGALTRYLCDKWNIPKDRNHIIGHNEYQNAAWRSWMSNNWPQINSGCNNHTDPGQYWDWNKFMNIVGGAPVLTAQPFSRLVEPGATVAFTVNASGGAPLGYQWKKGPAPVAGATAATLTITNVQPADAGGYAVVVTGSSGSVTSRVATLSVSPSWVTVYNDDFETDTSNNYDLFWGSANGVPDYTADWAFDYSSTIYTANGVSAPIPPAPNAGSTTHGVKLTVNKNDAVGATAAVSLYPKSLMVSNDYSVRFDMWINYNGPAGGGSGSTEYATFGINHLGNEVNWTTTQTNSDGLWFAVDGEGGSSSGDYRAYVGTGAASPTLLPFATSGVAASGASTDDQGDALFRALFPSPTYETAGSPGKHWVQCELSQINNIVTWQMNGVVIAQRTNSSAYRAGKFMIGYMDPYSSLANPPADNFILYDNVRLLISAVDASIRDLSIVARPRSAIVTWTSLAPATAQVQYGLGNPAQFSSSMESSPRTSHSVLLVGLTPGMNYLLQIHSIIGQSDTVSGLTSFSTDLGILVDNPQAQYVGNWTIGTSSPDEYGGYFQYATTTASGNASAQATYAPQIRTAAKYDVYTWHPQGANRTANAQISILSGNDFRLNSIDQTTGGGQWHLLADNLFFDAGQNGFAVIGNNTGEGDKIVAADAMRWVYSPAQDLAADGTVPVWWTAFYFGDDTDASLDPDHDGLSSYMEYVMGTDPTDPSSRFVSTGSAAAGNLVINFSPCLQGRVYTLQTCADLHQTTWSTVAAEPVTAGNQGSFQITPAPGIQRAFYRVSVQMVP
jgi:N-acetyl-anhydromuramyl-L-alanine amidase AmpD